MKKSNYITLTEEVSVDLYITDIIHNLIVFSQEELKLLSEELSSYIKDDTLDRIDSITPTNLEEEEKLKILKYFYNQLSWSKLQKIKDSL